MPKTKKQLTTVAPKPRKSFKQFVQGFINGVDNNILPFVALVLLAGLAVKGLMVYLPIMHENTRLVASILAVSFILVKAISKR